MKYALARVPSPVLCCILISVHLWLCPMRVAAQEQEREMVANLAAGRVMLYVAREGIVIGAVEQRVEAESQPPVIVPLGGRHVAILLGAVEWVSPASGRAPVRLDRDLPRLASEATHAPNPSQSNAASDIEAIGVAFLERLRDAAGGLHRKLELQPEEPAVELLLVNYVENYGPEAWLLRYRLAQDNLRGEYWRTRVLRPSYTQLYPPEKGQPRTLVEVRYPPDAPGPTLLELLNQNDERLARLRGADQQMARATERLAHGESQKASADDAAAFLRAALEAIANPEAKLALGVLHEQRGFEWILAPPELPQKAEEGKPREPGRPTLRKP